MNKMRKRDNFGRKIFIASILAYPILHILVFKIFMNASSIALAFQKVNVFGEYSFNSFNNFEELFSKISESATGYKDAIVNSILFFPLDTCVILPTSVVCAYYLFKKVPGAKIFRVVFFLPSIISIVALTLCYKFMLDYTLGPIPNLLRSMGLESWLPAEGFTSAKLSIARPVVFIYCLWAGIGYNVLLVQGAVSRIPSSLFESARLDGCGMWKEFSSIVVPCSMETIMSMFLLGCSTPFTIFLQPKLITGDNGMKTINSLIVAGTQGTAMKQIEAATWGFIFLLIGVPFVLFCRWGLRKLTPEVEY